MEEKKHCKWYNDEFCTNDKSPCVADYCPVVEHPELCKCRELDNEKELTDEEIVKSLECCIEGDCKNCAFEGIGIGDEICKVVLRRKSLDLIHRQKAEISLLKKQPITPSVFDLSTENGLLKAEIERLTKEHERIAWSKQEYLEWVDGFLRTHTVMKDRGEDFKMFDREWMCNTFWAKIEGAIEYIIDLEKQRMELQKQVDELTEKNKNLKYSLDTANGYIKKLAESCETNCEKFNGITTQQAVKNTAKEILEELDLFFKGTTFRQGYEFKKINEKLKEIAKRKGVEVK